MSKFTFVAGCDALAWPKRACIKMPVVAAAPSTNSRRAIMITSLLTLCIFRSSLSAKRRHGILDHESISKFAFRRMGMMPLPSVQDHVVSHYGRELVRIPVPQHTSDEGDAAVSLEYDGTDAPGTIQLAQGRTPWCACHRLLEHGEALLHGPDVFPGQPEAALGHEQEQAVCQIQRYDLRDFPIDPFS